MSAAARPDRACSERIPRRGTAVRAGCAVLAGVLALSTALPAVAAPNQHGRAEALFKQGRTAYMKGDFNSAYQKQRSAWQLEKSFDIAANLGQAELQLHLYRAAAEHFRYALDHFPPSGDAHKKQRLEQTFEKVRAKVGALDLHVDPQAAQVSVDGAAVAPPLPSPLFLEPGKHLLEVTLDGYTPQSKSVTAQAGGKDKLAISLHKQAAPAADPAPAPSATDSAPAPTSPPPANDKGDHHVETRTVAILAGAGLTAVALGVGVGFLVDASSSSSNASDLRAQAIREVGSNGCAANPDASVCVALRNANDHTSRSRAISTAGFIGAGVFGVATLGTALFWPKKHTHKTARRAHGVQVSPVVLGASGLGVDYPTAGLFTAAGLGVKGHF